MLEQDEADRLLEMEKHYRGRDVDDLLDVGTRHALDLDGEEHEKFVLDVSRARIQIAKVKYQLRVRKVVHLVRVDLAGNDHTNPKALGGERIPTPHIHVYREGYGVKYAMPLPNDIIPDVSDPATVLDALLAHCNVVTAPKYPRPMV